MLGQSFEGADLMSFKQLQHKHNLPAHDFFTYRNIKNDVL